MKMNVTACIKSGHLSGGSEGGLSGAITAKVMVMESCSLSMPARFAT